MGLTLGLLALLDFAVAGLWVVACLLIATNGDLPTVVRLAFLLPPIFGAIGFFLFGLTAVSMADSYFRRLRRQPTQEDQDDE